MKKKERQSCTSGHFNMVAVDDEGKPTKVPDLSVETDMEKQDYEVAEIVKNQALIRKKEVLKRKALR